MRAPHLTGNVLVRGDRPPLLIGTDGKDGRADAENADVRDGRVALPRGRGCPPAAVWRPDLYVCEGVMGSKRVRSDESSCQENKEEIEHFEPAPSQRDGVTKNTPRAIERPLFVDEIQDHIYAAWCL